MARRKATTTTVNTKVELRLYPFDSLRIGDRFIVPDMSRWASLRAVATRKGKRLGRSYSVNKTDQGLVVVRTA